MGLGAIWLSPPAPRVVEAIRIADTVCVSAISFYEIGQKVRLGKWPEMASHLPRLAEIAERQGAKIITVSAEASLVASAFDWPHRDPFDRLIGATAMIEQLRLVSADSVFDQLDNLADWPGRLW